MTLQNRLLPDGTIAALPMRGDVMGNRGILHGADKTLGVARWTHPHWIICTLAFKGRKRAVMAAGAYTELFFLDEAVALAAGHRPCAECRREAYNRYRAAWELATGERPSAKAMDDALHRSRLRPGSREQMRYRAQATDLPDGCFIHHLGGAWLIMGAELLRFSPQGYDARQPRPQGEVEVMTPAPSVAALRHGYSPDLHATARL